MKIKVASGSLNLWTSDGIFTPLNYDPNPPLIANEMRPMTDAEITAYCAQLRAEQEADGYDD